MFDASHAVAFGTFPLPSTSSATSTETASLHALVSLLTQARGESNRFLTALIVKHPKRQPLLTIASATSLAHAVIRSPLSPAVRCSRAAVERGRKKSKAADSEEDEEVDDSVDAAVPVAPHAAVERHSFDLKESDPKKPRLDPLPASPAPPDR